MINVFVCIRAIVKSIFQRHFHNLILVQLLTSGGSPMSLCPSLPSWAHTLNMWKRITSTTGAPVASQYHNHGATMWAARGRSSSR